MVVTSELSPAGDRRHVSQAVVTQRRIAATLKT